MGTRQQTGKPSVRTALEVAALPFVLLCNHFSTASISLALHLSSSSSLPSISIIQDDLQISSGEQYSFGQAEQLEVPFHQLHFVVHQMWLNLRMLCVQRIRTQANHKKMRVVAEYMCVHITEEAGQSGGLVEWEQGKERQDRKMWQGVVKREVGNGGGGEREEIKDLRNKRKGGRGKVQNEAWLFSGLELIEMTVMTPMKRKKEKKKMKDEGRRKKEEGRRKKEEGRRKKEEGRRKKEEGRRNWDDYDEMDEETFANCPTRGYMSQERCLQFAQVVNAFYSERDCGNSSGQRMFWRQLCIVLFMWQKWMLPPKLLNHPSLMLAISVFLVSHDRSHSFSQVLSCVIVR
ncbi:uncharacterized protein MONOS_18237 [Monocercomonoides exilis]|uniref:uncharacterized protein n=1 Tax=Monocercomonoides exilis TaxID=2049356 RepID=UPI00355AA27D|nr:hypothetical protein MONOS_18237 [Monocercomonoides exilis]